jgi:hypothetical protein
VITNIPSNLPVLYIFNLTFFISSWNQSVNNFINFVIMFSNIFLSENVVTLALGSQPRQRGYKVAGQKEARESRQRGRKGVGQEKA